jgi:hypothetical protein
VKTLAIVIGLLILSLFVLLRIKSAFTKYKAALNALLAKHTYQNLDLAAQQKVQVQTRIILFKGGFRDSAQQLEDREKYGFYALAMAELGISPSLPGESWQYIKNPFVALDNAENQIATAKIHLQKSHGVAVDI